MTVNYRFPFPYFSYGYDRTLLKRQTKITRTSTVVFKGRDPNIDNSLVFIKI